MADPSYDGPSPFLPFVVLEVADIEFDFVLMTAHTVNGPT